MARVLGIGAFMSIIMATYSFVGGSLSGGAGNQEASEFERKEYLRNNRRRPVEETLAEVGEGRCE